MRIVVDNQAADDLFDLAGPVADHLKQVADAAVEFQKARAPVRTGRLRNSIQRKVFEDSEGLYADIGPTVPYGDEVELGTSNTRSQPFVRPSIGDLREAGF